MKSLRNLALWFVESIHVFIDVFAPTITFSSLNWTSEVEWELLFFEQKLNEENKKKRRKKKTTIYSVQLLLFVYKREGNSQITVDRFHCFLILQGNGHFAQGSRATRARG
jgi:hypothetical protein